VCLAYLICRLLDTFEDDPELSLSEKKTAISGIIGCLEGGAVPDLDFFVDGLSAPEAEIDLVRESEGLFYSLSKLPERAADAVRKWAAEMGRGMILFLEKQEIETLEELERYCYYVAGTVGWMLTALFSNACGFSSARSLHLDRFGENFGLCLQFVNIIKDSGADFREGRCFIPSVMIREQGVSKEEFFLAEKRVAASIVYGKLIQRAEVFIKDAEAYVRTIPRHCFGIRRFCILPLFLAKKTLKMLSGMTAELSVLETSPKISRRDVKRSFLTAYPSALSNTFFRLF